MPEGNKLPLMFGKYTEIRFSQILAAILFIPSFFVFFVSDDVVSKYSEVDGLVKIVGDYVPAIDQLESIGVMVEVNKFIYSLMWVLGVFVSPFFAYMSFFGSKKNFPDMNSGKVFFGLLFSIFFCWHSYTLWLYGIGDGDSRVLDLIFGSKIGVFLHAPFSVLVFWGCFWMIPALFMRLVFLEAERSRKNKRS